LMVDGSWLSWGLHVAGSRLLRGDELRRRDGRRLQVQEAMARASELVVLMFVPVRAVAETLMGSGFCRFAAFASNLVGHAQLRCRWSPEQKQHNTTRERLEMRTIQDLKAACYKLFPIWLQIIFVLPSCPAPWEVCDEAPTRKQLSWIWTRQLSRYVRYLPRYLRPNRYFPLTVVLCLG